MGADAEGDALVARAQRHDFRGVHPGYGQDAPGEDVEEEEAEGDEDPLGLLGGEVRLMEVVGGRGRGLTAMVFTLSMIEIITMQNEQPAALNIMTLRRPAFSMKKYGLLMVSGV